MFYISFQYSLLEQVPKNKCSNDLYYRKNKIFSTKHYLYLKYYYICTIIKENKMEAICVIKDIYKTLYQFEKAFSEVHEITINEAMLLCCWQNQPVRFVIISVYRIHEYPRLLLPSKTKDSSTVQSVRKISGRCSSLLPRKAKRKFSR